MTELRDPLIGQLVLGRYRIVQLLARGGMAAVFLARVEGAAGFSKPVVVKRILPHLCGSSDDEAQFILEAQILSNLRHPGIVNVLDFGRLDGSHLMVLEYVHGYHLGQWLKYVLIKRGQFPWEAGVWVILQVLTALHYAHTYTRTDGSRAAIVHRDISPANILIDLDGTVRLTDFGIARIEAEQTSKIDRNENIFRGKFPYAAPELFSGGKATALTDVYACGVVLYQILSGTNPFTAEDATAIVRRVLTLFPIGISKVRPDVPAELDQVLERVMSKEPEDRHPSAKDFAAALRAVLPRTESEIAGETAALVRRDFTGDLPRLLQRESLASLEVAWHKVASQPNIPLGPTAPPTDGRIRFASSQEPTIVAAPGDPPVLGSTRHAGLRLTIPMLLAGIVSAAVALAASLFVRERHANTQTQFLVVESREDTAPSADASSSAAMAPGRPATAAAPQHAPSADLKATRQNGRAKDPQAALSLALSRRQAEIQSCFRQHAAEIQGSPQLSIRFSINGEGRVLEARISPAPIAATALGNCLERIARTTNFGPQDSALEFTIPITARTH